MAAESRAGPDLSPLGPERLRVEWGPVSLVVAARWPDGFRPGELAAGGRRALEVLEELAALRRLLAVDVRRIRNVRALPQVARGMVAVARPYAEWGVTPMIAVAGAVADAVADTLAGRGATRVSVSNGGDVALRLAPGESVSVGVVAQVDAARPAAKVRVAAGDDIGGVATSGFGGRSLTLGIADAATVFATSAATADVTATLLGNAVDVDTPAVERAAAEDLDPETDLRGRLVTRSVGLLQPADVETALDQGEAWARSQWEEGRIRGAVLTLRDRWRFVGWPGREGLVFCRAAAHGQPDDR